MATTATPETSDIRRRGRQRLIGAVAIALLLVVFVPMIFDSEPAHSDHPEPSLTIPSKDKVDPLPVPPKVVAATAAVDASKAAEAPAPAPVAAPAPAKADDAPKAVETPPKAVAAPVAAPAQAKASVAAAPRLEGFAVQVGAFKDEAKLKQARDRLVAAKVPHYIERRDTSSGELIRLRAGPFATREAADKALATLKAASISGQVVPLP